jgi:site-specific recombinase XerD
MTQNTALVPLAPLYGLADGAPPPAMFLPEQAAAQRFFDFFTANIRNPHTRRVYYNAVCKFAEFCSERGVHDLADVKPVHVSGYVDCLRAGFAKPTIKQHLAAVRMLFDCPVVGRIISANPAHAVRGPRHVVVKGRTPVLNREEARALLAGIDVSKLRDGATGRLSPR